MTSTQTATSKAAASGSRGTIVVGYAARPEGTAALHRAVQEAQLRGFTIIAVHAGSDDDGTLAAELERAGLGYEVRPADPELDPAEQLIATAEETGADFIVIGLRRRSAVGKLLLGSSAQRVLLDAACPVLAVKAETPA